MANGSVSAGGRATEPPLGDRGPRVPALDLGGPMMRRTGKLVRRALSAIVLLALCEAGTLQRANAQGSFAERSEATLRWADAEAADVLRDSPSGTVLPPPSPAAIAAAFDLFASSPLTGARVPVPPQPGVSQPSAAPLGQPSPTSSVRAAQGHAGTPTPSPPPITIQLPPPPPERYAPAARWRPPVQVPDPSTIPIPPLAQAPPQQQRPPIQLPSPPGETVGRPPIDLPVIPLPPHPPEAQAPWRQGGRGT